MVATDIDDKNKEEHKPQEERFTNYPTFFLFTKSDWNA